MPTPNLKALPEALNKAISKLEDAAHQKIMDIEAMGDRGVAAVNKFDAPIKEANDTFAELEKALEESNSNRGPLPTT